MIPNFNEAFCKQHISTKAYKAYFYYLKRYYPDIDIYSLCLRAGLSYGYLLNEDNWVSVTFDDQFTSLCIKETQNPNLCFQVGKQLLSEEVVGKTLFNIVKYSVSISFLYSQLPRLTQFFNKVTKIKIEEAKNGYIRLLLSPNIDHLNEEEKKSLKKNLKNILQNTLGHFAAVPTCKDLPIAQVNYKTIDGSQGFANYEIEIHYQMSSIKQKTNLLWRIFWHLIVFSGSVFLFKNTGKASIIFNMILELSFWQYFLLKKYSQLKTDFQVSIENLSKLDEKYLTIYKSQSETLNISNSYERFVPKEFILNLKKGSIVDVRLGDCIDSEVTVLFADIRGFTELSESMEPNESFQLLNSYFAIVNPIIHRNGGFIEKYLGDGFLAIFSSKPQQAIDAAVEIINALSTGLGRLKAVSWFPPKYSTAG